MKPKIVFVCQECGAQAPKWMGRCTECGAWNSLVEERPVESAAAAAGGHRYAQLGAAGSAKLYADVELANATRLSTGIGEFDRVLGGGIVPVRSCCWEGSRASANHPAAAGCRAFRARIGPVLYASGEESEHQIKSRGDRLVSAMRLSICCRDVHRTHLEEIARLKPALVLLTRADGLFNQVSVGAGQHRSGREAATQFSLPRRDRTFRQSSWATSPRTAASRAEVLEHVVDTVLYFEGERHHAHRVVRAVKNRFGAASELGVFEMTAAA
jgi:DNA repair protein RadA/Sms